MLQQFGQNRIVCLDRTHGLNAYHFELITLLVINDHGSGFPCSFMFTNLKNTIIYSVMFSATKTVSGLISPKTFMTDIMDTFYTPWSSIIGLDPHNILYLWYIDKAWYQKLT